ncbi:MAG TPA: FtsX-like permease family protein, partial [Caldimonas sp.]|nr:FtsX-like permease family protein [Caldimonas sp.]
MGASRAHVVAVVVQEVFVLAVAGASVGVLASAWLVSVARSTLTMLPRLAELRLDARAAMFAAGTGVAAAVLCGLVPALLATRDRQTPLVASGSRVVGSGAHRWQRGLVAAQVALSLLLSASAALLLRSYYNITNVDVGFVPDHVLTFHVGARWTEDRTRVGQMQEALLAEVSRVPGVESVGFVNFLPAMNATLRYQVQIPGLAGPDGTGKLQAGARTVTVGYLQALKVPLLAGEWCPPMRTDFNAPPKVMVNRQFAERFGQGMTLAGHQMTFVDVPGPSATISGIIGDVAEDALQAPRVPFVYSCASGGAWPDPYYAVRTSNPATFAANLTALVRRVDPTRAVFGVRPLSDVLHESVESPRLDAAMVAAF